MKRTKLTFEKVIIKGEPKLKLLDISNCAKRKELPDQYFMEYPFYYNEYDENVLTIIEHSATTGSFTHTITINCYYSKQYISYLTRLMKKAGKRLTKINKDIEKMGKTWTGKTIIKI